MCAPLHSLEPTDWGQVGFGRRPRGRWSLPQFIPKSLNSLFLLPGNFNILPSSADACGCVVTVNGTGRVAPIYLSEKRGDHKSRYGVEAIYLKQACMPEDVLVQILSTRTCSDSETMTQLPQQVLVHLTHCQRQNGSSQ